MTWCGGQRETDSPSSSDGAGARPVNAGDDVEERGLARAVGSDERDHLARLDVERDAIEGDDPTEANAQLAHLEQRHLRGSL